MDSGLRNVLAMFGFYQIQYSRLTSIMNDISQATSNDIGELELIIDINDTLDKVSKSVFRSERHLIVAGLLNLIIHYKRFFANFNGCEYKKFDNYLIPRFKINIYIINTSTYSGYVNSELELFKTIVKYIKGVYYIDKQTRFSNIALSIMNKNRVNIILTKDKANDPILADSNNYYTIIPLKWYGNSGTEEESVFMNNRIFVCSNVYRSIYDNRFSRLKSLYDTYMTFSPYLYSLVLTLGEIYNNRRAIEVVYKLLINGYIVNGYCGDFEYLYNKIKLIIPSLNKIQFINTISNIDPFYNYIIYNNDVRNSVNAYNSSWMIDLYDPEGLKQLNDEYLYVEHIDIVELGNNNIMY